jgi:hypothetical protein
MNESLILILFDTVSFGWVGGSREDTANVGRGSSDSDVSLVSPGGSPGVLDEEEVDSVQGSISDSEDSVVEVLSASLGDDSGSVGLEGNLVGLNGNSDWLFVDGSLELVNAVLWNINESLDVSDNLGGIVLASSVSGSVWVRSLTLNTLTLDVSEGIVHETTVAAHVSLSLRAVNKLLLRVGVELLGSNELSTLDGSGGRESPA